MRDHEFKAKRLIVEEIQNHAGGTPSISGMTEGELEVLDGVTAGLVTASKALVVDSSSELTMPAGGHIETGRGRIEVFDDFLDAAIDVTNNWIVFAGTDGDADAAATVAGVPEGAVQMGSGGTGAADDGSVLSLILLSQGSLVSLGTTVFETRVSFDQLTGTSWNFGLSDVLATDAERSMFTVDSGVVADGGLTITDAVAFAFSSDATATTKWQFCNESGGTINAVEDAHTTGPVADTWAVLRIEVDADGTARWYLDGTLVKTLALAVATTAILIPFIGGNSGTDADVPTDVDVDHIYFGHARPASNA